MNPVFSFRAVLLGGLFTFFVLAGSLTGMKLNTYAVPPMPPVLADETFDTMTPSHMERIFKSFDLKYKEVDNGTYSFEHEGSVIIVFQKDKTLQLYASWKGVKLTLSRINEWNRNKRFAKAYLDNKNEPCLESDYELTGGVTDQNVREWMKTYVALLKEFKKFISE